MLYHVNWNTSHAHTYLSLAVLHMFFPLDSIDSMHKIKRANMIGVGLSSTLCGNVRDRVQVTHVYL